MPAQTQRYSGTYFIDHGAKFFAPEGSQRWLRVSASDDAAARLRRTLDGDGRITIEGRLSAPIVHRRPNLNRRTLYVASVLEAAAD